jgi:hypothetical protein
MTPEQTLDWLAQQHFDQCREDRPVQHWIRKMKSELPEQRTWVGLTEEEINACDPSEEFWGLHKIARAIEAKLKEKNT